MITIGIKGHMNMQLTIKASLLVSSLLISSTTFAGQVTIPNTFSSGTAAVADDVNNNFTAVKTGVDDNDGRITSNTSAITGNASNISSNASAITDNASNISSNASVITANLPIVAVDGVGEEIGVLVNLADDAAFFDAFNQQGYLVMHISFGAGLGYAVENLMYLTSDCSGTAYSTYANGTVFFASNSTGLAAAYYVDKNSVPMTSFTAVSISNGNGCSVIGYSPPFAWPVIINDPVVTGVPNIPYTAPITLQRAQ